MLPANPINQSYNAGLVDSGPALMVDNGGWNVTIILVLRLIVSMHKLDVAFDILERNWILSNEFWTHII